jgi:hypothetical protein
MVLHYDLCNLGASQTALQFSVQYILIAAFSSASSAHILLIAATARR